MTTDFRALCADLHQALEKRCETLEEDRLLDRSAAALRAALAQPVAEGPKPVVDYSRVTEIATEDQIRSAAQYLVKKRNCDGDLIPAIEYAIARWGRPTPQPVPVSERLPGPEDCIFPTGECWWFDPHADGAWYVDTFQGNYTHWLTPNALPTPEATNG